MRGAIIAMLAVAAPAVAEPAQDRSETTALVLSSGGTAVSVGLMVMAARHAGDRDADPLALASLGTMLIGPSLGHWYAGDYLTTGLVARGLGTAFVLTGALEQVCFENCDDDAGVGWMIAGTGVIVAGALWDIATAPRTARRYNEAHVALVPAAAGTGLAVAGAF